MKKIFTILCLLLLCSKVLTAQTRIGYTNGSFERTDGVRIGTGEKQGAAIKFTKEKSRFLKGKKIVGVRAVFGTRNLENLTFFITKTLGGEVLFEKVLTGASSSWKEFKFDAPYIIGDETEFYAGYTLEASTSYRPMAFDRSNDMKGLSWAYSDGTWVDVYGNGYGVANIQLLVEDVEPFTDLCLKTFSVNGYYKAENPYQYSAQVFNFGTQAVNSFDATCKIGDNEPVVYSFKDQNIATGESFDFKLPEYISSASGAFPVTISISKINGSDDMDMTDNVDNGTIFIYPTSLKKNLLLEGFTGQTCGNCPTGHKIINEVLESVQEPVIEVFHHAGFEVDDFTMIEDGEYCWFYNGTKQYAPAVMVNRMWNPDLKYAGPVGEVSANNLESTITKAAELQPYVSVDIDNKFDETTRILKATVKVNTYVKPDAKVNILNVFVVQDSVIARQTSGASKYVHRYAFRGALTSPWGYSIVLNEGEEISHEFEYTLPDEILSTYPVPADKKQGSIPTELKNMYLVAFVSAYTDGNPNKCAVYNSNIAKFTEGNVTSIGKITGDAENIRIYVDGNKVNIQGEYTRMDVYDMTGKQIRSLDAQVESFTMDKGLYIVRALCKGKMVSQKVAITK